MLAEVFAFLETNPALMQTVGGGLLLAFFWKFFKLIRQIVGLIILGVAGTVMFVLSTDDPAELAQEWLQKVQSLDIMELISSAPSETPLPSFDIETQDEIPALPDLIETEAKHLQNFADRNERLNNYYREVAEQVEKSP